MIDKQELRRLARAVLDADPEKQALTRCGAEIDFEDAATPSAILAILDELEACKADAERYRWLCDGNGYFMEENMLCHVSNEKDSADKLIDDMRALDGKDG